MLEKVHVGVASVEAYESTAGRDAVLRLQSLAKPLRGLRVLHLNSSAYGGGVAEILFSEVPLLSDLGLNAEWHVVAGENEFFKVTKKIHNGLQGGPHSL